jgi:hypothetical protein
LIELWKPTVRSGPGERNPERGGAKPTVRNDQGERNPDSGGPVLYTHKHHGKLLWGLNKEVQKKKVFKEVSKRSCVGLLGIAS